jgi:hypothetical protein
VDDNRIEFERDDGTRGYGRSDDKARIYRNILSEGKKRTSQANRPDSSPGSRSTTYTYPEITPLVAEIIEKHSLERRQWMAHEILAEGLAKHELARTIMEESRSLDQWKTLEKKARIVIAGFSRQWSAGEWDHIDRIPMKKKPRVGLEESETAEEIFRAL